MEGERGKLKSPVQDAQVSQGRLNQMSEFVGEEISDTSNWVEIYRTADEWEVKLIQATLGAQQIRCRPVQVKQEKQTALYVAPEHEVTALELVSRIDVAITDSEIASISEENAEALKRRDMAAIAEDNQTMTTESGETLLAQHDDIGSVVYVEGQGYELRVGTEPFITIADKDWDEFTDFSAQRQEFVMLLRHEYPQLYEWIHEEKLLAEFIRLIEMTYQDEAPIPVPHRQYSEISDSDEYDDSTPYNSFALLSMTVAVISLLTVLFRVPWQVNLVMGAVVLLSGVIALFRIRMQVEQLDPGTAKTAGSTMALCAIVLAGLVVLFSWWLDQRPVPEAPAHPHPHEHNGDR